MEELELEAKARKMQNKYLSDWRAANKTKVALYNVNYWKKRVLAAENTKPKI